ncbi:hypothetical protein CC2G_014956 [Coprinopsis cinerea AmutBmut pab1-1]|nr:hypothetical protein CC2G_014956 [Coprinopsis cinerea AmutBmut pab1-1]
MKSFSPHSIFLMLTFVLLSASIASAWKRGECESDDDCKGLKRKTKCCYTRATRGEPPGKCMTKKMCSLVS